MAQHTAQISPVFQGKAAERWYMIGTLFLKSIGTQYMVWLFIPYEDTSVYVDYE